MAGPWNGSLGSSSRNEADLQVTPRTSIVNFANPRQGLELFLQCDIIDVKQESDPHILRIYILQGERSVHSISKKGLR